MNITDRLPPISKPGFLLGAALALAAGAVKIVFLTERGKTIARKGADDAALSTDGHSKSPRG